VRAGPYGELNTSANASLLEALEAFDERHAAAAARLARAACEPEVAAAALSTARARKRAKRSGKFRHPEQMLFTRDGYEQSSSDAVARHRAVRFAAQRSVVDLCCGIGSDTVALARAGCGVHAVDSDRDALACARANVAALGAGDAVRLVHGDAATLDLAGADAAFADPSRRHENVRTFDAAAYSPPLSALLRRARSLPGGRLCVKVAPGIDFASPAIREELDGLPLEIELVSEHGTCKEAVLWCGEFARADGARRATVIDRAGVHVLDGRASAPVAEQRPLAAYVGEPDAAVIRAGVLAEACRACGAAVLDRHIAYVTGASPLRSSFIRWFRVVDAMPFSAKRVRSFLRSRGVGHLTVKTRAFPMEPKQIEALVRSGGHERATLICTTIGDKKTAIVCAPVA
jgi:SAM-dependent methyltransferase